MDSYRREGSMRTQSLEMYRILPIPNLLTVLLQGGPVMYLLSLDSYLCQCHVALK